MATTAHGWPYLNLGDAPNLASATQGLANKGEALEAGLETRMDPPRCRAYRNTALTVGNSNWLRVGLDGESWDTLDMHDTVTGTYRITIATPGLYEVKAGALFGATADGLRLMQVRMNSDGVETDGTQLGQVDKAPQTGTFNASLFLNTEGVFASGARLEMFVRQTSSIALPLGTGPYATFMSVRWVDAP